jgi:hypothetical protein
MANQTATDYGFYPPRAVQVGANRMHANIITTISASASDNMYMFQIPPDCFVVGGGIKASVPTGTSGNIILEIGTPANNTAFGTYTLSGTAVLATKFATMISPVTVSSSGTDALTPVVISVLSAATSTTSLSIYLLLEYVLPGIIN